MISTTHFRKIAVATLAMGCVGSANAWITVLYGNYTTNAGGTTNNYSYLFSDLMPNEAAGYSYGYNNSAFDGNFTLTNGAMTLNASFVSTASEAGGTYSFVGVWTETSEVGLPNVVSTGTISGSFDHYDPVAQRLGNGDWGWNIVGQVTPEPTPYAVLGLGVVGLIMRRRKTR